MSLEQNLGDWSFLIYAILVFIVVGAMLGISFVLGERHNDRATNEPFESGILITGEARKIRFSAKFYLIAMFFVIFDLEAIFIYAWAVSFKELGWAGYIQFLIFAFLLVVALVYLWQTGGLEFGPNLRKIVHKSNMDEVTDKNSSDKANISI